MGEGEPKVKIEGASEAKKKQRWQRRRGAPQKRDFKASTPGLENMVFKQGDAADAAAFEDVKKALAKYAGTNFRVGSNMAQVAIDELIEPNLVEPSPPTMSTPPTPAEEIARKKWEYGQESLGRCQAQGIPVDIVPCEPRA